MMSMLRRSLRLKLIVLLTAVASLTVLIASTGLGAYQWQHARNSLYEQEFTTARMTADSSAAALVFNDQSAANETLAALSTDVRITKACLYNKSGSVVGRFSEGVGKQHGPCPALESARELFTLRQLHITRSVQVRGSQVGLLYLEISLADLQRFSIKLMEVLVLATLCATLFAFMISSVTERWVSGPIVELTHTALAIAQEGNATIRARRNTEDEVGVLIDQFNAMLDRLHEREAELRVSYDQLELKVQERTRSLQDEIAERKMVELALSQAKTAAEEGSRAKSSFLATMSHELRTPLNAIIGYSEMLFEDAQEDAQEGMRSDLGKILSSARHLLAIISDVLDLSKIEAGQMELTLEESSVKALVNDVLPMAEVLVRTKRNTLRVIDKVGDCTVQVDSLRFRQSLLNLISNACKFTSDGVITITTSMGQDATGSYIAWSVADTGIGIPEEHLARLFKSFSQVDSSVTRRFGGSGLGLCISQELCKAMNGRIEVESTFGVGSTFTIYLPLLEQAVALAGVQSLVIG